MTAAFIPSHLAIEQADIPVIARALRTQHTRDDNDAISWPEAHEELLSTFEAYSDVILSADSMQEVTEQATEQVVSDNEVQIGSDEGSDVDDSSSDVRSYDMALTDYADLNGYSESYAARLARTHQIDALKVGGKWKVAVKAS